MVAILDPKPIHSKVTNKAITLEKLFFSLNNTAPKNIRKSKEYSSNISPSLL